MADLTGSELAKLFAIASSVKVEHHDMHGTYRECTTRELTAREISEVHHALIELERRSMSDEVVTIGAPPIPLILQREWMAQALFEVDAPDHREWEDVWLDERERYLAMADAAIARIGVPSAREHALGQNNRDLLDRFIIFSHALEKISCRHVNSTPLWWQEEARAALEGRKPWDGRKSVRTFFGPRIDGGEK